MQNGSFFNLSTGHNPFLMNPPSRRLLFIDNDDEVEPIGEKDGKTQTRDTR